MLLFANYYNEPINRYYKGPFFNYNLGSKTLVLYKRKQYCGYDIQGKRQLVPSITDIIWIKFMLPASRFPPRMFML